MNRAALLLTGVALFAAAPAGAAPLDWWLTPDQQGQRLYDRANYAEAAQRFTDPARIGAALFAAGDFEGAAAVFGRQPGPEGPYNQGNALIFLGRYDEAIAAFDLALQARPGWIEAEENRAIAVARRDALAPPDTDAGGTGGQMGADEIVIDDSGRVAASSEEQVIEAEDEVRDEASLRALWLRRVDTRPADFLAAKFNAQLARDTSSDAAADDSPPPGDAP